MAATISDEVKQKTAILLIPGSFTPPSFWTLVTQQLRSTGFETIFACPLMSADAKSAQKPRPASMHEDAFYIREVIRANLLPEKGLDVVLVMNSYAGICGTEALRDLPGRATGAARDGGGDNNNNNNNNGAAVVGAVYLSSFLPFRGDSLRGMLGDYLFEPVKTGVKGAYMDLPPESGPGIFSDWASEGGREKDIEQWFGTMVTHSSDSFDGEVSWDAWGADGGDGFQGRVLYVVGEKDAVVPPALADEMVKKVNAVQEGKVKVKMVEGGGHMMHVTRPQVVVDAILEVLGS